MSLTLTESRARAAALSVSSYDVELDLTREDCFRSRTTVRFDCHSPGCTTFIELADAEEVTGTLNGEPLPDNCYADGRIALAGLAESNELVVDARLPYVSNGDGMHAFTDPVDGERYVAAYCGMDIASKVFACFDQPDLKAPITLGVRADPAWTVLANGRPTSHDDGSWAFAPTPPISTYLFVVCAGPWHSVRFEHAGRPFGWHARRSLAEALDRDAAELREVTTRCFDHYTRVFDEPYAFDSYDQVFAPAQNWGALETPGCVTFRDEYLTRGEPTAVERLQRASVIAHEMAHMWFGDLVTMRWWEDSWLNESFADYMGYEVAGAAAGFDGAWVTGALQRKPTAYVADARRSTHPVAEDTEAMTDVDTAFGNFDMVTYAKGNALLRQLVTWLGEEDFLAGSNAYLSAHAFGNATLEDFLAALAGATDRDTGAWAQAWLRTTGFDTIRVEREGDVPVLHRDGSRSHRFHVGVYDDTGTLVEDRLVDLADEPLALTEHAGRAVVPNSRDETYARLELDPVSWRLVDQHLSGIANPLTRALLWATAVDRAGRGELTVSELLDLAARQLPAEANPLVTEGVLGLLRGRVLAQWLAPGDLATSEAVVAGIGRRILDTGDPDLAMAAARAVAATSADADELSGWLADPPAGVPVDADLRWDVVVRLAQLGRADATLIDAELARDPSATGELGALRARAATPTAAAKAAAWQRMTEPDTSNRQFQALADGLWSAGQEDLVAPYLTRYLDEGPDLARRRGQAFSSVIGKSFPFVPLSDERLKGFRDALTGALEGDVPTVLRRSWNDRLDDLDVAIGVRAGR